MNVLSYRAFSTELIKIATEVQDADIRALNAENRGRPYYQGGQIESNGGEQSLGFKPKTASFTAYTPVGTYNVLGRKPTAQSPMYETASNFAGTALKGGMTGAAVGTLANTLRHGHDLKLLPKHLGRWTAAGAGIAVADRAIRRHNIKKQLEKVAHLGSGFTPGRELHAGQETAQPENVLHRGPVKPVAGLMGNRMRLPPQGV